MDVEGGVAAFGLHPNVDAEAPPLVPGDDVWVSPVAPELLACVDVEFIVPGPPQLFIWLSEYGYCVCVGVAPDPGVDVGVVVDGGVPCGLDVPAPACAKATPAAARDIDTAIAETAGMTVRLRFIIISFSARSTSPLLS
ncbi:MAG: hypothetical protein ABSD74_03495 [Rhizomicrobium sp.]